MTGDRHLTALLGNHDGDGVRLLCQADGGAVARAEIAIELGADRERQKARGRRQAALDQHLPSDSTTRALRYEIALRAMDRATSEEAVKLERHVGVLATTGSVSPFIGLLGTVWGVMSAFLNIGAQGSASLVVVAPGIAEALIATVAGLAAAIPSVVGYNHLVGRLREIMNATGQFASEYLDRRLDGGHA